MLELIAEYKNKLIGEFIFYPFSEADYNFITTVENGRLYFQSFEPSPEGVLIAPFSKDKFGKLDLSNQESYFNIKIFERNQQIRTLRECWIEKFRKRKSIRFYKVL